MKLLPSHVWQKNVWVARCKHSDVVLGATVVIKLSLDVVEVGPIVVLPEHRGQGIGRALVSRVVSSHTNRTVCWVSHNPHFIAIARQVPGLKEARFPLNLLIGWSRIKLVLNLKTWLDSP